LGLHPLKYANEPGPRHITSIPSQPEPLIGWLIGTRGYGPAWSPVYPKGAGFLCLPPTSIYIYYFKPVLSTLSPILTNIPSPQTKIYQNQVAPVLI